MKSLTTLVAIFGISASLFIAHKANQESASATMIPTMELTKKNKKNNKNNRNRTKVTKIESKGLPPENELGGTNAAKKMAELVDAGRQSLGGVRGQTPGQNAAAAALEAMKKKRSGFSSPNKK